MSSSRRGWWRSNPHDVGCRMCARAGDLMDEIDTASFDEPGFVARDSVQRAIDMDDERAGIKELSRLIAEGLDVSALGCDGDGLSVFYWAAKKRRTSLAAALIDAGATLQPEVAARGVPPGHEDTALH